MELPLAAGSTDSSCSSLKDCGVLREACKPHRNPNSETPSKFRGQGPSERRLDDHAELRSK
jgi:hypothetical protein